MEKHDILLDPFGLPVIITEALCGFPLTAQNLSLYNDYRSVIECPAFIIEMETEFPTRYYYRAIGWETTLLIRTEHQQGRWLAKQCAQNPLDVHLKSLAERGNILAVNGNPDL